MGINISCDYRDLFKILNRYKVRYLVAGAYAVSFYAEPRFTKDIDLWVEPEIENAQRLYKALINFGAPLKNILPEDFVNRKIIYQIGVAPIRIDIMMDLAGIDFKKAWISKKKAAYSGISINILGIGDLMVSKRKFKRQQDKLDLLRLKRVIKKG